MSGPEAAKIQVHLVVLVDGMLAGPAWSQLGLQGYLERVLNLLSVVHSHAKVCAAPIIFASSTPSAAPALRYGGFVETAANILQSISQLLDASRTKMRPVSDATSSNAMLQGVEQAIELFDFGPTCEVQNRRQHIVVISASDLPSLFSEDDESHWDATPTLSLGLTWQDLPHQLHSRSVSMSVIASRFLPRLEAVQRKVVAAFGADNAPANAVAVQNPEHIILFQGPAASRVKRSGSPTATRATEDAKRPRLETQNSIDVEALKTMTREQLQAQLRSHRETASKLFAAVQAQVNANKLTPERGREAAASLRARTAQQLALIESYVARLSPKPQPSTSAQQLPAPVPSSSSTRKSPQPGGAAPVAPIWRGHLGFQVPEPGGGKRDIVILACIAHVREGQELGITWPAKIGIEHFIPLEMVALQAFAARKQLPVVRLTAMPAAFLEANAPGQNYGARNDAHFKQLITVLDTGKKGALIRIPGLPAPQGLLVISPGAAQNSLIGIVCKDHPIPPEVVRHEASPVAPPPAALPPPQPATASQLEALQAMLMQTAAASKGTGMAGLGIGHPAM